MRFDLITLFPELVLPFLQSGVTRRAFEGEQIKVQCWNPRDFADGAYRRVDDRPFGGGPGMVMLAEPLFRCLQAIRADRGQARAQAPLILFSPIGQRLDQTLVQSHSQGPGAILLCGRYEGIDQRFIDRDIDEAFALGDIVVSGGELPAMMLIDAILRWVPGVLQDAQSAQQDSFVDGLLDCPHYTRPEIGRAHV